MIADRTSTASHALIMLFITNRVLNWLIGTYLRYKAWATSRTQECRLHNSVKLNLHSLELDFNSCTTIPKHASDRNNNFFSNSLVRKLQEHVLLTAVLRKANCYVLEPSEIATEAKFDMS